MTNDKRIQIQANITSAADHVYERIEDRSTREIKVSQSHDPPHSSSRTVVTTNPYEVEVVVDGKKSNDSILQPKKGSEETKVQDVVVPKPGYDTSQL